MTDINAASVESWQAWLATEHEAVWLYSLIGGRFDEFSDVARTEWNRHRDTRDRLTALIGAAGEEPAGTRLAYRHAPTDTVADAQRAAQTIETKVEIASLTCIGDAKHRSEVVAALRAAARAEADWGAKPTAFPGLS